MSVADPFGHHLADAAGGLQADGIEAGRDEAILEFGRFAEVVAHVRSEAFRSAEELLNAGLLQGGDAAHGIQQHGLEMAEVPGNLAETEVIGNTARAPGRACGSKAPTSNLPASYLK